MISSSKLHFSVKSTLTSAYSIVSFSAPLLTWKISFNLVLCKLLYYSTWLMSNSWNQVTIMPKALPSQGDWFSLISLVCSKTFRRTVFLKILNQCVSFLFYCSFPKLLLILQFVMFFNSTVRVISDFDEAPLIQIHPLWLTLEHLLLIKCWWMRCPL